jgi:hypothetical protein
MKHKKLIIIGLTVIAVGGNFASAQSESSKSTTTSINGNTVVVEDVQPPRLSELPILNKLFAQNANNKPVWIHKTTSRGNDRNLIIPDSTPNMTDIADLNEDLNVMSHILEKAVATETDKPTRAMGITLYSKGGPGAGAQNIFIEGHGALFFLNVNFPILPPPPVEKEVEPAKKTSSEWEEARNELLQPERKNRVGAYGAADPWGVSYVADDTEQASFDAEKVETLKKDLITALKNAAHIRKLKSGETVSILVSAPGSASTQIKESRTSRSTLNPAEVALFMDDNSKKTFAPVYGIATPDGKASSKMILRARKSDAEAFQKGNLDYDEFRKKVDVIIY